MKPSYRMVVIVVIVNLYSAFMWSHPKRAGTTFNDLEWPLTWISRSRHFWSRISQKWCVLGSKSYYSTSVENHRAYLTYRMVPGLEVWWPRLTSKRVARVCQHQLSFLLPGSTATQWKWCGRFYLTDDVVPWSFPIVMVKKSLKSAVFFGKYIV